MSELKKHLTLDDRLYIEYSLNEDRSLKDIAKFLCKDPTTVSKKIKLHRIQNTWTFDFLLLPRSIPFAKKYGFCHIVFLPRQNPFPTAY